MLAVLALTGTSTYAVFECTRRTTTRSMVYLGESKQFERHIDEATGNVGFTELSRATQEIFLKLYMERVVPDSAACDALEVAKRVQVDHPKSCMGPLLESAVWKFRGNFEAADQSLARAHAVAKLHPDWAAPFQSMMPPPGHAVAAHWEHEFEELVGERVWRVDGPFYPDGKPGLREPIEVQSTVVRLADGSLVIVNPTTFDERAAARIDALGRVRAIVTTTAGHGDAIAQAHEQHWPDAELYGSSSGSKHRQPSLPWRGFVGDDDDGVVRAFGDGEFRSVNLRGHAFDECTLVHTPTRTLHGLTDLVISFGGTHAREGAELYKFAMGMNRAPLVDSADVPIEVQSYFYLFTKDRGALRESIERLVDDDAGWDVAPLGHGGVLREPDARRHIKQAYRWLLDDAEWQLSLVERIFLPLVYLHERNLIKPILSMAYHTLKSSLAALISSN
jgi:hypothetical protein